MAIKAAFTRVKNIGSKVAGFVRRNNETKNGKEGEYVQKNKPSLIKNHEEIPTSERIAAQRINAHLSQKLERIAAKGNAVDTLAEFARIIDRSTEILTHKARDLARALSGLSLISKEQKETVLGGAPKDVEKRETPNLLGMLLNAAKKIAPAAALLFRRAAGFLLRRFGILGAMGALFSLGVLIESQDPEARKKSLEKRHERGKRNRKQTRINWGWDKSTKNNPDDIDNMNIDMTQQPNVTQEKSKEKEKAIAAKLEFLVKNKITFKAEEIRFTQPLRFKKARGGLSIGEKATAGPAAGIDVPNLINRYRPRRNSAPMVAPGQPAPKTESGGSVFDRIKRFFGFGDKEAPQPDKPSSEPTPSQQPNVVPPPPGQSGLFDPISPTRISGRPGSHSASMGEGQHQGVDMMAPVGSPVYASKEGTVVKIGKDNFKQPTITIKHPDGTYSRYLHMHGIDMKVGDKVQGGQQIGTSGSANHVPHLHFERWTRKPNRAGIGLIDPRQEFGWDRKGRKIQGGKPIEGEKQEPQEKASEPPVTPKAPEPKAPEPDPWSKKPEMWQPPQPLKPDLEPPPPTSEAVPHYIFTQSHIREMQGARPSERPYEEAFAQAPSFSDYIGA